MKLHHSLAEIVFHRDANGQLLFLPYGRYGTAYLVHDATTHERIRTAIGNYLIAVFAFFSACILLREPTVVAVLLAIILVAYVVLIRNLVEPLVRHTGPLNLVEQPHRTSGPAPMITWRDMRLASSLALTMSLALLVLSPDEWPIAVLGIALFGWALLSTFTRR